MRGGFLKRPELLSATLLALIVAAKVVSPFQVGWDLAIQLEAGSRLAQGLGLTSSHFVVADPDLSVAAQPGPLTWFPPIISVLFALLKTASATPFLWLKVVYAGATIAGWFGWVKLIEDLLHDVQIGQKFLRKYAASAVAMLIPIASMPAWQGTDVFLWAITPMVLRACSAQWRTRFEAPSRGLYVGLLIGLGYLIRYASAVLVVAVGIFFVLCALRSDLFRRARVWILSVTIGASLPVVAYTLYKGVVLQEGAFPAYLGAEKPVRDSFVGLAFERMSPLALAILPDGLAQRTLDRAFLYPWTYRAIGASVLCSLVYLAICLRRRAGNGRGSGAWMGASALLIGLPLLLCGLSLFSSYNFASNLRYYVPAIPLVRIGVLTIGERLHRPVAIFLALIMVGQDLRFHFNESVSKVRNVSSWSVEDVEYSGEPDLIEKHIDQDMKRNAVVISDFQPKYLSRYGSAVRAPSAQYAYTSRALTVFFIEEVKACGTPCVPGPDQPTRLDDLYRCQQSAPKIASGEGYSVYRQDFAAGFRFKDCK